MKIYISGQITGLDIKEAQGLFEAKENQLKDQGHEPYNPMKLVPFHPDKTWNDYMIEDIKLLFECEAIYMLDNWQKSKGAKIEHAIAVQLGLKIL